MLNPDDAAVTTTGDAAVTTPDVAAVMAPDVTAVTTHGVTAVGASDSCILSGVMVPDCAWIPGAVGGRWTTSGGVSLAFSTGRAVVSFGYPR